MSFSFTSFPFFLLSQISPVSLGLSQVSLLHLLLHLTLLLGPGTPSVDITYSPKVSLHLVWSENSTVIIVQTPLGRLGLAITTNTTTSSYLTMRSSILVAAAFGTISTIAAPAWPKINTDVIPLGGIEKVSEYFNVLSNTIRDNQGLVVAPTCDLSLAEMPDCKRTSYIPDGNSHSPRLTLCN